MNSIRKTITPLKSNLFNGLFQSKLSKFVYITARLGTYSVYRCEWVQLVPTDSHDGKKGISNGYCCVRNMF